MKVRVISQETFLACPHVIIVESHYREDSTYKCNDPSDHEMPTWGYTWDAEKIQWV
jgi:hypothetical protein